MFYPQSMTEIELIVPAKDLVPVTRVLSGQGVFQQTDSNYLNPDTDHKPSNSWQETAAAYAGLERRIQAIMQNLRMEEALPPTSDFESLADLDKMQPEVDCIEQAVRETSDQLAAEQKRIEQFDLALRELEPLADVDLDISELRKARYLSMMLGSIPVANIERLQTSLTRIPHVFVVLRQEHQTAIVWLAGTHDNEPILDRAARSAYLNPLTLPEGYQGTPAKVTQDLHASIQEARENINRLNKRLAEQRAEYGEQLYAILWDVRASRMMSDAIVHYGQLKYTYLIVGWVITSALDELIDRLRRVSKDILVETHVVNRNSGRNDVPVSLAHSRLLRPFQQLVTTYAQPRYEELDPTLLIAVTFPLLFGAMFGDVGQGIVLALLGALLSSHRIKALESLSSLGGLITACGASATIFGFLYGSVFGIETLLPALWFHPIENIMTILMVAIAGGIVLLSLGFLIGMFNAFAARDWGRLLFAPNGLAGFVLYWSMIGLVGGAFLGTSPLPTGLLAGLAVVAALIVGFSEVLIHLISGHRPLLETGVGSYAIQVFFELFETLISFLSNTLSYVRVGAFAVAHAGLSSVIFILGEMVSPGHGVGYWIVVALGNLFIIGFEGLIVGIQTMRLEYYEFFSKFFKGGGMRYAPLQLRQNVEK